MANESTFLMKSPVILRMSISLSLENTRVSPCKCCPNAQNEQSSYFFLTKDQVKVCIDLLIAFNEDKQKVCTLGTVPDRVFIATSCYDVLDDLISIVAQ